MPSTQNNSPAFDPFAITPISEFRADLSQAPLEHLRERWREAHPGAELPKGISRDLMIRGIMWKEQCSLYGGLSAEAQHALDRMVRQLKVSGTLEIERSVKPKAGTRIIREWRGKTYVVEVTDDGFLYDGMRFTSLSRVARAITGTRWSGPRFFGLKPSSPSGGEGER